MFRIAFIVEDKNLPKVLHALQGLALNMEPPQPVVNAAVQKGKVVQASAGTAAWERVWDAVSKFPKGSTITSADIKECIVKVGSQVNSFSYFVKVLKDNNVIANGKKNGSYIIK